MGVEQPFCVVYTGSDTVFKMFQIQVAEHGASERNSVDNISTLGYHYSTWYTSQPRQAYVVVAVVKWIVAALGWPFQR